MTREDGIVAEIGTAVRREYGMRLARAVLYGSRARGDARPDSDYDVAVFLDEFEGLDRELDRTAALAWRLQRASGAVVSLLPFPRAAFGEASVTMRQIRDEGRAL